jgi:hypothetical protein
MIRPMYGTFRVPSARTLSRTSYQPHTTMRTTLPAARQASDADPIYFRFFAEATLRKVSLTT